MKTVRVRPGQERSCRAFSLARARPRSIGGGLLPSLFSFFYVPLSISIFVVYTNHGVTIVRDSSIRVSAYMAGFLGELGEKKAVPALIDAVKRENRYNYAALRALRDIGDPRAIPVFENFLENDANTQLKKQFAKEALEKIRSSTGGK